ncbi:branched-chain amino acid ABC transporter substrate-binding protein [Ornithinimicrobium avium]|uniref:Branched-chain amino acid ABC transporter substrate-binding protein n=1 Tax=Ornithinimicrobium avium TaxID=2283195 RepID=A0A345NL52_9MICO|nr:branched-chain amino acid ABC transporter substrate-binding protein [Ornithinimicrobium avium]AXH95760.1 branched-chain amino acid ABC transporter substrate-binding protein [Ornithinimicrobium avium]
MSSSTTPRRRAAATLTIAAATALILASCSGGVGGDGGGSDEGPIKLGMLAPFSGSEAAFGDYMKNGAQLAIDEINDDGGVDGRDLELVVEDDACDATASVAAAQKLVTAGVLASVGGYCSGATLPTIPVFSDADIPMVIPAANSNAIVGQGAFMINGTGAQQAEAGIKFATKLGVTKVAAVNDQTDYSKDLADTFIADAEEAGGFEVVLDGAVNPDDKDFSANVKAIIDAEPEFVYWTGYYQAGGLLVRQLREAGYEGTVLVGDGTVDAQFAEIAGDGFTDDVFGTFTKTPDMLEGADDWIAAYKDVSGGEAPGPYSIQSYDAVRVVAEGMKDAGSTDGKAVNEAIAAIDGLELSSGPLKFTEDRTLSGGGFVIVEVGPEGDFVLHDDLQD